MTDTLPTTLAAIAGRLRQARGKAQLSLDAMAQRSGISKGTLVNLENGRGNPSVAVLCQAAAALGLSLADLVEADPTPCPAPFQLNEGKVLWRGKKGGEARLLVSTSGPEMVELWRWRLAPGETYKATPHSTGTHEILLVQSGRLGVSLGQWSGTLSAGKGILLKTDVEHRYWCEGSKPVHFRMFVAEGLRATP